MFFIAHFSVRKITMPVFQIGLIIYQNNEPSNLAIELYAFLPTFDIPNGELHFVNGELFYVCNYSGNEWVFFVKEIIPQNNIVEFERVLICV